MNNIDNNIFYLYSDGGARNNNDKSKINLSAWAFLVKNKGKNKFSSGACLGATNNQMELKGLIEGLKFLLKSRLNDKKIIVTLDSKYILYSINHKWLTHWKRKDWIKNNGEPVRNKEYMIILYNLLKHFYKIEFKWTKGHRKNKGNVFVDKLVNKRMDNILKGDYQK